ncbi:DUF4129 domain-containing protein [Pedococcus sp. 2YAF34]|uniref:DUF4129 domain-containing protein n=1 Tax=Pedococcus sp. 2YAF34 TaxID=3233032 RepID=UPI003F97940E
MTRRDGLLLAGGGATLLLAAWVSASGPVAIFARRDLSGYEAPAPGEDYGTTQAARGEAEKLSSGMPGQDQPLFVTLMTWAFKVALALVVLAVLVAAARAVREWWQTREEPDDGVPPGSILPEAVLRGAEEGEELLATGTPANAVVAAWVALESAVRSVGIRDDASLTSAELVTTVLRSYSVERAPLDTLAALYREARFSTHPVGEDMRERAREALQQVQSDLRRVHRSGTSAPVTTGHPGRRG